jgi:hypothetical protein
MKIYRYYYVKDQDDRLFCGIIRAKDTVDAHRLALEWLKTGECLTDIEPLEGIPEEPDGIVEEPVIKLRVYKIYYSDGLDRRDKCFVTKKKDAVEAYERAVEYLANPDCFILDIEYFEDTNG